MDLPASSRRIESRSEGLLTQEVFSGAYRFGDVADDYPRAFPEKAGPWEPRHQATGFRIRGAAHQIVHRPVSNREAHPFRETL